MSKKDGSNRRARYTVEFKLEAVRLVKAGQEASVTARVLGVPKQTLSSRPCEIRFLPAGRSDVNQRSLARQHLGQSSR